MPCVASSGRVAAENVSRVRWSAALLASTRNRQVAVEYLSAAAMTGDRRRKEYLRRRAAELVLPPSNDPSDAADGLCRHRP